MIKIDGHSFNFSNLFAPLSYSHRFYTFPSVTFVGYYFIFHFQTDTLQHPPLKPPPFVCTSLFFSSHSLQLQPHLMTLSCSLSLAVTEGLLTRSCTPFALSSSFYHAAATFPSFPPVISSFSEGEVYRCLTKVGGKMGSRQCLFGFY